MKESEDVKNWDDFRDRFNNRYYTEGIAELGRWYIKNKEFIHHHIPDDENDKTVIPIPLSARGITAFLLKDDFTSFSSNWGPNSHLGSHSFYEVYFNHCIECLRIIDHRLNRIEEKRKPFTGLVQVHIKNEEKYFQDSALFYNESRDKSEKPHIADIKEAALYYFKWVKEMHLKEFNNFNNNKLTIDQIALKYYWEGKSIPRNEANEIVRQFGWKSGERLYHRFTYFSKATNRTGVPPRCTPRILNNKISLFKMVIDTLDETIKNKPIDELKTLENRYKAEYE